MIVEDKMAVLKFSHKDHEELIQKGRCDYYPEILSTEEYLKCKEYETLQANHANQMIVFIIIIFVIFLCISNNNR
jgi:hypothetical protein